MKPIINMSINLPSTQRYFCIIPAAGCGNRAGGDIPKQYWTLHQRTIIEHTIHQFLAISKIEQIIIPLHENDRHFIHLPIAQHAKVKTVVGGPTRADSVRIALDELNDDQDQDWVFVHDAVRPNIKPERIVQLAHALLNDPVGGCLAIVPRDTIKEINGDARVKSTLDRQQLRLIQTPQLFRLSLLKKVYKQLSADHQFTDDAGLCEAAGYAPRLIPGDVYNLKLTYPEDHLFLSVLMQQAEKING